MGVKESCLFVPSQLSSVHSFCTLAVGPEGPLTCVSIHAETYDFPTHILQQSAKGYHWAVRTLHLPVLLSLH